MNKRYILIVVIIVILGASAYFMLGQKGSVPSQTIATFEECVQAGYPVGESYPRQCWTPDGRHFVEEIEQDLSPASGPLTITGEMTCLLKIGQGSQTMECAMGLKGTDGRHYGLKNLFKLDPKYKFSVGGLRVEVSGMFSPEEMKGPDGNKYDVVGVIDVTSIKEIDIPKLSPTPTPTNKPYSTSYRKDGTCPLGYLYYGIPLECVTSEYMKYCETNSCPICLAGNTLIDTPAGLISIKDLQVGMQVWTINKAGQRVSSIITKTSRVPVPSNHQMVHLVLNDDRDLFVSPGHPTTDGRTVDDLTPDEVYDNATIVSSTRIPYDDSATYDLLPSGDTGFYWANGILIGSTLR